MNKANILIADDIHSNRELFRLHLDETYNLNFAHNGQECLDAIKKHKPNLLLLDIEMPRLDGWEVCRFIRLDKYSKDLPIIVVSSRDEVYRLSEEYHVDAYLTIPYTEKELLPLVEKYIKDYH